VIIEDFAMRENQLFEKQRALEIQVKEVLTQQAQERSQQAQRIEGLSSKIAELTERIVSEEQENSTLKVIRQ
jgi:hypothetical protein